LAAVAVFATTTGGFLTGLEAFLIFAITMGLLIFILSFLGTSLGPAIAVPLRLWGRRIQVLSAVVIVLVGGALIYSGINPGFFDRLILPT
jgi:putative Mn2+ efflux pump MntP